MTEPGRLRVGFQTQEQHQTIEICVCVCVCACACVCVCVKGGRRRAHIQVCHLSRHLSPMRFLWTGVPVTHHRLTAHNFCVISAACGTHTHTHTHIILHNTMEPSLGHGKKANKYAPLCWHSPPSELRQDRSEGNTPNLNTTHKQNCMSSTQEDNVQQNTSRGSRLK